MAPWICLPHVDELVGVCCIRVDVDLCCVDYTRYSDCEDSEGKSGGEFEGGVRASTTACQCGRARVELTSMHTADSRLDS